MTVQTHSSIASLRTDDRGFKPEIRRWGAHALAYSALQPGVHQYRKSTFSGFIPYMNAFGYTYVLGDPVMPVEYFNHATRSFLKRHPRTVFCQISADYANLLHNLGCEVNGFGVENFIDLDEFEVTWKIRRNLKRFHSKHRNNGYYTETRCDKPFLIWNINDQWLSSTNQKTEMRFLARPFDGSGGFDTRVLYLYKNNMVKGFCQFDPVYSPDGSGNIDHYLMQHLRVHPDEPSGTADMLLIDALLHFKQEGMRTVSLGLSPLHRRHNALYRSSKFFDCLSGAFYNNNWLYNFRTLGEHKDRYRPVYRQTFIAAHGRFNLMNILGLMKVNKLI